MCLFGSVIKGFYQLYFKSLSRFAKWQTGKLANWWELNS